MCALFRGHHPAASRRAHSCTGATRERAGRRRLPVGTNAEQVDLAALDRSRPIGARRVPRPLRTERRKRSERSAKWWARRARCSEPSHRNCHPSGKLPKPTFAEVLPRDLGANPDPAPARWINSCRIEGARYAAAHIPGAHLVELDGIDHFPFAGDTDESARRDRVVSDRHTPRARPRIASSSRCCSPTSFAPPSGPPNSRRPPLASTPRGPRRGSTSTAQALPRRGDQRPSVTASSQPSTVLLAESNAPKPITLAARQLGIDIRRRTSYQGVRDPGSRHHRHGRQHWRPGVRTRRLRRGPRFPARVKDLVVGSAIAFGPTRLPPIEGRAREMDALRGRGNVS